MANYYSEYKGNEIEALLDKQNAMPTPTAQDEGKVLVVNVDGAYELRQPQIDDGSITESKIADGAVTKEKLAQAVQTLIEDGYVYKNIAAPIANPGTPKRKEFWIVPGLSGTFTHFGNITLSKRELALLKWNGNSWSYDHILYINDAPKSNSDDLVSSGGVYSALQGKQDTINDLSDIRSGASAGATAYQKPVSGIPASDLSSAVQTSLEKAETALQSETDPVFSASPAAGITAGDIMNWDSKQDAMSPLTTAEINSICV